MSANAAILLAISSAVAAPSVTVITTSGAGNVPVPAGYNFCTMEALAGGGSGFGSTSNPSKAGGGGGQHAISNAKIAVTPGNPVYYSVGAANQDSWCQYNVNAVPTLATTGCRARFGSNASSGVAGVGNTAGGVGASIRNGGNGGTGNNSVGGGGGGATTAGNLQTAGTDTTGLSAQQMGGGTGGASTAAGTAPGGGGGSNSVASNPAGAIGRVRIVFYVS